MNTEEIKAGIRETVARYDLDEEDVESLTASTLRRLDYRRRHGGKVCARCGQAKSVRDFGPDARKVDGLQSTCRRCDAARKA